MKVIELDLTDIPKTDASNIWADSSAKSVLENAILDFAGYRIKISITLNRKQLEVTDGK